MGERLLDPLSGLAFIAMQEDNPELAHSFTSELLDRLDEQSGASAHFPAQIYYVCSHFLLTPEAEEVHTHREIVDSLLHRFEKLHGKEGNAGGYSAEPLVRHLLS